VLSNRNCAIPFSLAISSQSWDHPSVVSGLVPLGLRGEPIRFAYSAIKYTLLLGWCSGVLVNRTFFAMQFGGCQSRCKIRDGTFFEFEENW